MKFTVSCAAWAAFDRRIHPFARGLQDISLARFQEQARLVPLLAGIDVHFLRKLAVAPVFALRQGRYLLPSIGGRVNFG